MIDRKPGLIVECAGVADAATRSLLREHTSLWSGGHNIAGSAVCDGGMMISLARMKSIRVSTPRLGRAGNTLGDVDKETQRPTPSRCPSA